MDIVIVTEYFYITQLMCNVSIFYFVRVDYFISSLYFNSQYKDIRGFYICICNTSICGIFLKLLLILRQPSFYNFLLFFSHDITGVWAAYDGI